MHKSLDVFEIRPDATTVFRGNILGFSGKIGVITFFFDRFFFFFFFFFGGGGRGDDAQQPGEHLFSHVGTEPPLPGYYQYFFFWGGGGKYVLLKENTATRVGLEPPTS